MRYPARFIFLIIKIGVVALIIPACSKPAQVESGVSSTEQPEGNLSTPAASSTAPENFQSLPATALPGEPPAESAASSLEQRYLVTTDPDAREDITEKLRDLDNTEAVQVFGRLFQRAADQEEKLDLLATLDQMDTDVGKLPILAAAINPNQSQEVRAAAIDSLADLDEPGALQMLQGLTSDPDPQIRDAAKNALQSIAEAERETPR